MKWFDWPLIVPKILHWNCCFFIALIYFTWLNINLHFLCVCYMCVEPQTFLKTWDKCPRMFSSLLLAVSLIFNDVHHRHQALDWEDSRVETWDPKKNYFLFIANSKKSLKLFLLTGRNEIFRQNLFAIVSK